MGGHVKSARLSVLRPLGYPNSHTVLGVAWHEQSGNETLSLKGRMIIKTFIKSGKYICGRSRSLHTQGALGYTEKLACRVHFVSCGLIEETVVYCSILVLDDYETRLPAEINKGKRKRTVGEKGNRNQPIF